MADWHWGGDLIQFIVGLLLLGLVVVAIRAVWTVVLQALATLAIGVFWTIAGVPYLIGMLVDRMLPLRETKRMVAFLLAFGGPILFLGQAADAYVALYDPDAIKYGALGVLMIVVVLANHRRARAERFSEPLVLFQDKDRAFFRGYIAVAIMLMAAALYERQVEWPGWTISWIPVAGAFLFISYLIVQEFAMSHVTGTLHDAFTTQDKVNATAVLKSMDVGLEAAECQAIYAGVTSALVSAGQVQELELANARWVFNRLWHERVVGDLQRAAAGAIRHGEKSFLAMVNARLGVGLPACGDYVECNVTFGEMLPFADGRYFVPFVHSSHVVRCASCGLAALTGDEEREEEKKGEWYCCGTCRDTETRLMKQIIQRRGPILDAMTAGYVVTQGANAWNSGHRVFAAGGQGHGFAAERGNTWIDRLLGRSAKVQGDNNVANGADRVVQGRNIQTKYHRTAARSVGGAFDGQGGNYRYVMDGMPMALEVPSDQYDEALKVMAKKILAGKVPNVTATSEVQAIEEARKILIRGHLTYQQAVNITKFGRVESLSYDAVEGVVAGGFAAGISFTLTSFIFLVRTGDARMALRIGVVQSGKTFVRSALAYVGAQQLHRLETVQTLLKIIPEPNCMSSSMRSLLSDGLGVPNNAVSKALRGTLVSSVVVITLTTVPEMVKLVRGRVSKAQFLRSLAVNSAGVAGGVAGGIGGGIVGGAVGGPPGAMVGRFVGGVGGGLAGSALASWAIPEEDQSHLLEALNVQIEYLARTFLLCEEEVEAATRALEANLTKDNLETIHAARNKRTAANSIVKPWVVDIVAERPTFVFTMEQVTDACADVAA